MKAEFAVTELQLYAVASPKPFHSLAAIKEKNAGFYIIFLQIQVDSRSILSIHSALSKAMLCISTNWSRILSMLCIT